VRIGIIGAGNIGAALTTIFTSAGHEVAVANSRGPDTLAELAAATGATAVNVDDAAIGADVVVVTIPMGKVPELPAGVLDRAREDVVVIDTCNYYPARDGRIEAIEQGETECHYVSGRLGRPVIKAFNNIAAQHLLDLRRPKNTPGRIALPVAGDDARAKAVVMQLVDEIGFDPVDAGSLDESWRQEPGSPVYGTDLDADQVRLGLTTAKPVRRSA
jgi:predicted dinucleotide-binding enzyme